MASGKKLLFRKDVLNLVYDPSYVEYMKYDSICGVVYKYQNSGQCYF